MAKQNWRERHADILNNSIDLETIEITRAILAGEAHPNVGDDIIEHISLSDILHEIDAAGGPGPNFHYDGGVSRLQEVVLSYEKMGKGFVR